MTPVIKFVKRLTGFTPEKLFAEMGTDGVGMIHNIIWDLATFARTFGKGIDRITFFHVNIPSRNHVEFAAGIYQRVCEFFQVVFNIKSRELGSGKWTISIEVELPLGYCLGPFLFQKAFGDVKAPFFADD